MADAIKDTLEIVGWRLKAADAALEIDLDDPPPVVLAGAVRLQQVLVNLISNAADAVEGGRRVGHLDHRREADPTVDALTPQRALFFP